MSRLFVVGAAPLPFERKQRQYAANLRTWHFTKPLLDAGHTIRLVACRLPNTYSPEEDSDPVESIRQPGLEYLSVRPEVFEDRSFLQDQFDEFEADAVIGVNTYPASRAVRIATEKPIWADLNGWVMAEAQTKTAVYDDDRYLSHFWKMERAVLERADVISTVSQAQAHAVAGELATLSRLGRATFGYSFLVPIPNAVVEDEYQHKVGTIRGTLVGEDDFVVLWVGGYNTWTDVDLLYEGLIRAMEVDPQVKFVSTGGVIEGHDEITFKRFQTLIAKSKYKQRFHFVGWVRTEDVPSYYYESNLGLNVDGNNYETIYGARNRLNDMMKVGLPLLTTVGTEVSHDIERNRLGLTCSIGDAGRFAEQIVWAAENRDELEAMARRAREFAHREYSYRATTEPLLKWVEAPQRAPDRARRVALADLDFFEHSDPTETARGIGDRGSLSLLGGWRRIWKAAARRFRRKGQP
jgi:glycosyltransferase involved in cell wall biosynthesis